jgi:hypothetical protein
MKGNCHDAIWSSLQNVVTGTEETHDHPPVTTVGKPPAMSLSADQKRHHFSELSSALAFQKVVS